MKVKSGMWSGKDKKSGRCITGVLAYDDYWNGQEYEIVRAYIMPIETNIILPVKNSDGLITKWYEVDTDTLERDGEEK